MSQNSSIEWTDATWNPVRGCTKISQDAPTATPKFRRAIPRCGRASVRTGVRPATRPEKLLEPLPWARPKMVFVNSMSDLFHEDVPATTSWRLRGDDRVPVAHLQVLTKRSARLAAAFRTTLVRARKREHLVGRECREPKSGLPRIADLQQAPARVRFLSVEPLLEDLGEVNLEGIQWVIVGGESGLVLAQ